MVLTIIKALDEGSDSNIEQLPPKCYRILKLHDASLSDCKQDVLELMGKTGRRRQRRRSPMRSGYVGPSSSIPFMG